MPGPGLPGLPQLRFSGSSGSPGGDPAEPVGFTGFTGQRLIIAGRMLMMGWSLDNIGASAGAAVVYDGLGATGSIVACPMVQPNASNEAWFGERGVLIEIGLFADFGADTWRGAFYVVPYREAIRR